jgi:hypothetical protein
MTRALESSVGTRSESGAMSGTSNGKTLLSGPVSASKSIAFLATTAWAPRGLIDIGFYFTLLTQESSENSTLEPGTVEGWEVVGKRTMSARRHASALGFNLLKGKPVSSKTTSWDI